MNNSFSGDGINLPYVEFGKIFRYDVETGSYTSTSEYEGLDRSDNDSIRRLFPLYQKVSLYSIINGLPFSVRLPGYGNFTVALMEHPDQRGNFIFLQLQQRKEQEHAEKNGHTVGALANRSYNQAHFTEVTLRTLTQVLQEKRALYTSLVATIDGQPRLKDYWVRNEQGISVMPRRVERPLQFPLYREDTLDVPLLAGLTNLLYSHYRLQGDPTRAVRQSQLVVAVIPGMDLLTRLEYIQAVQAILLKATGVITFSLDYVFEPSFMFYFCSDKAPGGHFQYQHPHFFSENDIRSFAEKRGSYFHVIRSMDKMVAESPVVQAYLQKPIQAAEAVDLAVLMMSDELVLSSESLRLIIKNIQYLRQEDRNRFLGLAVQYKEILEEIFRIAPELVPDGSTRFTLYRLILTQLIKGGGLSAQRFFYYYAEARNQSKTAPELSNLLIQAVQACPSSVAEELIINQQTDLVGELLKAGGQTGVRFNDGISVLEAIFSRPGRVLEDVINGLLKEGGWDKRLENSLVEVMINSPEIWTGDWLMELKSQTVLSLPSLSVHRIKKFINDQQATHNFEQLSTEQKCSRLRAILFQPPSEKENVLRLLEGNTQKQLRKICLQVCYPGSLDNLHFASWWIRILSEAGAEIFTADYAELIRMYRSVQPPMYAEETDQNRYFILSGNAREENQSLFEACRAVNLENLFESILKTWVENNILVSVPDICRLIDGLPSSNKYLARLIQNGSKEKQAVEIQKLSSEQAHSWLLATAQNNIRRDYLDENGRDRLYAVLCGIREPTPGFVFYMLAQDPASLPVNSQWSDHIRHTQNLFNQFRIRGGAGEPAETFVQLVSLFNSPPGLEVEHHYGLTRVAQCTQAINQYALAIDNRELPLFLYYALEDGIDSKIRRIATAALLNRIPDIQANISRLRDDIVYTLDHFCELSGMLEDAFRGIRTEGQKRRKNMNDYYY